MQKDKKNIPTKPTKPIIPESATLAPTQVAENNTTFNLRF